MALTIAAALAAFGAGTLAAGTRILDTAEAVSGRLDALRPLALSGKIAAIDLRDGGDGAIITTPALAASNAAVLGLVAGPHVLHQRIAAADVATATLATGFAGFIIADSAANVIAHLPDIQALWRAGSLGRIMFTDPAPPTLVLAAAVVAANIDALQAIGSIFDLQLSDSGRPDLILPLRDSYVAALSKVIQLIGSPVNVDFAGPISAASLAGIVAGIDRTASGAHVMPANSIPGLLIRLPQTTAVLGSAENIAAWLPSLQAAAVGGRLATIGLRADESGGESGIIALTPAQFDSGADALARLAPNVILSQLISASQAAGAALDARFAHFTIQDSLADILANLAGVDGQMRTGHVGALHLTDNAPGLTLTAAELAGAALVLSRVGGPARPITLSDDGTPSVAIAADVLGNAAVRANVLGRIAGPYQLVVTGAIGVATASAILAENDAVLANLGRVRIAGLAADIVANLATLKTLADAGRIAAIDLLDGGVVGLGITLTTSLTYYNVLTLISSPYLNNAGTGTSGRMSASNFLLSLSTVQQGALYGSLKQVSLSNSTTPTMAVSASDLSRYLEAFTKLVNTTTPLAPYVITLTNGGTPTLALAGWQVAAPAIAVLARVSTPYKLAVTGNLGAGAAALLAGVASKVDGRVAITDFSGNVAANLAALQTLASQGRISGITLLDGGVTPLVLTPAQAASAPAVLAAIASAYQLTRNTSAAAATAPSAPFSVLTVTDSAANIQAHLAALQPLAVNGRLTSITVTGGGAVALSLTAAEVGANADALLRISNSFTIGLIGAGTPDLVLHNWQVGSSIAGLLARITTPFALTVDGPISAAGASALVAAGPAVVDQIAPGGLTIRDTPAGFAARISDMKTLVAAGAVGAIELTGGARVLSLAAADIADGQAMLALMPMPAKLSQIIAVADIAQATLAEGFSSFTVADTAANVLGGLAQVQALAASGRLGRLRFTDTAPELVVSSASIVAALDSWAAQDERPHPITLAGDNPVLTIPAAMLGDATFRANILEAVTNPSWRLAVTGRLSAADAAAIVADDGTTLAHVTGGLTVAATGSEIRENLNYLAILARRGLLGAIDMLDAGLRPLELGAAPTGDAAAALALISGSYRLDTPAGITAVETLGSLNSVAFNGFGPGAAIDIRDVPFAPSGMSFTFSGTRLRILKNDTLLATLTVTPPDGTTYSASSFYIQADATGGTTLRAVASPIAVTNTRTSTNTVVGGDFYSGAVGYLQRQFINPTGDPVNVAAGIPNVFLHGGGATGGNALQVHSGQNVIDGGIGSNFLVGGTDVGGADTFFLDGRGDGVSWGTVVNFHRGDAVTFWGWKDGVTTYDWFADGGAPGFSGATIHARLGGGTGAYDASITFAGIDLATAQGFAFVRNGVVGDTTYAYIASL